MGEWKQTKAVCTSVFQKGTSTTKAQLTAKWMELIQRIEKEKAFRVHKRSSV